MFCFPISRCLGLFYFSGHGFETDGQSYLVPVDAGVGYSTKECICDQEVLDLMQYRNTALNTLLLDICRKPYVILVLKDQVHD